MMDVHKKTLQTIISKITMQMSPIARTLYSNEWTREMNETLLKTQVALNGALSSFLQSWQFSYLPLLSKVQKAMENIPKDWKDINTTQIIEKCVREMYDNKWFPSVVSEASVHFLFDYYEIDKTTRNGSKRRTKLLDKLVFSYYNQAYIRDIKREWRIKTTNLYQRRTLLEALRAYERKEYATTLIILSTFWQGLIYEKSNKEDDYRKDKDTKEYAHQLLNNQYFHELCGQYFDDYIYYICNNASEVKEGVPGRHAIVHNWYKTYPSRKEALNAILFTNTLITTPKKEEKDEQSKR